MHRVHIGLTVSAVALLVAFASAAPRYSDWSPAEPVSEVNSGELDFPGSISKDGLTLYFQRSPLLGIGEDIWIARRESKRAPWGVPMRLPDTVNSDFNDRGPTISPDGHWLFFGSDRPGGVGTMDIWASWRAHVHEDTGWTAAVNLGAPVNSAAFDSGPAFWEADSGEMQVYLTSARPGGLGATDIYVSTWHADGTFSTPVMIRELSSAARDERPYLRHDGLELFLQSTRAGGQTIWVATRATTTDAWSAPQVLSIATPGFLHATPAISWDGTTLFFGSNRLDAADIFMSVRTKANRR